ncbi:MAG: undecaprenyl/decaprenyl-phosphate alpha-N-acetylglucosaminyl 1-phosphate transferase [Fibrobacterales bacterium]
MDSTQTVLRILGVIGVGLITIPIAFWISKRFDIVDKPDRKRKLHGKVTPYLGGLILCAGMSYGFVIIEELHRYWFSITGLYLLFIVGLIDDAKGMRSSIKLLFQCAAIQLICFDALVGESYSSLATFILSWGFYTVVGIGAINSMNLIDGLDGLAVRMSLSLFAVVMYLGVSGGNTPIAEYSLYAMVACIPFILINTHPAKMFMGDAGSLWMGGVLFWLFAQIQNQNGSSLSVVVGWMPLLLSIPVVDVGVVMLRRAMNGHSIMKPDRNHIHHRVQVFLGHCNTVECIGIISALWSLILIILLNRYSVAVAATVGVLFYSVNYAVLFLLERNQSNSKNTQNRLDEELTFNQSRFVFRSTLFNGRAGMLQNKKNRDIITSIKEKV